MLHVLFKHVFAGTVQEQACTLCKKSLVFLVNVHVFFCAAEPIPTISHHRPLSKRRAFHYSCTCFAGPLVVTHPQQGSSSELVDSSDMDLKDSSATALASRLVLQAPW